MNVFMPLEIETLKKLNLIKEIYQRALTQSQFTHRNIDRMLAIIQYDLANETVLKTIVIDLNPTVQLSKYFDHVINQAKLELKNRDKILSNVTQIQHIHKLRNETQHHARFPTELELNDCRTYTRDFLIKTFYEVWGVSFESISLIDSIQNSVVKNLLLETEQEFEKENFLKTVINSKGAFQIVIDKLADSITGEIDSHVNGIVVTQHFKKAESNKEVFKSFQKTRELVAFQVIGINLQEYLRYLNLTCSIRIATDRSGIISSRTNFKSNPTKEETEYIFNFVINAIISIENLNQNTTNL